MASDLLELPDGRQAQVWHGGVATGPLVMFLHGTPDSRLTALTGDAAAVRAGVHLVAVNRPGYGRSDPAESGLASVADDTVAVADSLAVHRFAVLGASGGGPYALACAARHPDRVSAVGAVACPGVVPELDPPRLHEDPEDERDARVRELLEAGDVEAAVVELSAAIRGYRDEVLDDDDARVVDRWSAEMHPDDVEVVRSLPVAELAAGVRESLASPVGYIRDVVAFLGDWEVRPEGVRSPTWLWYGTEDRNAAPRHGTWLAQRVPGSTLVVREQTAHMGALLLHWDEMLATLRDATDD
jgi:pimeloyl-ACP methyl ester carboxylesterase